MSITKINNYSHSENFYRNLNRALLGGLLIFELLNKFKIFKFAVDFTWLGLIITVALIFFVTEITFYLFRKKGCRPLASWTFFLITAAVYIDALGDILQFYSKYGWYDQIGHFAGGMAAGAVILSIVYNLKQYGKIKMALWGAGLFALFAAVFGGVIYELEEYFEDVLTGSQRLGDGFDTANDLFLDILGAGIAIAVALAYLYFKKKRRRTHNVYYRCYPVN